MAFQPSISASLWGGRVHEIMIKAAKKAIYGILGTADINDEELITAFTGAEALINSRPLTYQTTNPDDDVSLDTEPFSSWTNRRPICARVR